MQAAILAGGEGTRLRPLTYTRPKALVPLLNRPMILHLLDALPPVVDQVLLAASYRIDDLTAYFASHRGEIDVRVVAEAEPLGTGGALKNLQGMLKGTFLALNGDVMSSLSLAKLLAFHEAKGGVGALALWEAEDPRAFGIVALGEDGRIQRFQEKPSLQEAFSRLVNAGMYVLEPEVLDLIPPGRPASLEREVFPRALGQGLYGMPFEGYWADAGTRQAFLHATQLLQERAGGTQGEGCVVDDGAQVVEPVTLGPRCALHGSSVGPFAVLGGGCQVGAAKLSQSVLLEGVTVEDGAVVEDSLIGADATIGRDAYLRECIVADATAVEAEAKLVRRRVGR